MKRKADYPVTHTQIKTSTASSGFQQVSIYSAYLAPVLQRILIDMVRNTVFAGSATTNPLHFQNYDITNFVLHVDAVQYPSNLPSHSQ